MLFLRGQETAISGGQRLLPRLDGNTIIKKEVKTRASPLVYNITIGKKVTEGATERSCLGSAQNKQQRLQKKYVRACGFVGFSSPTL